MKKNKWLFFVCIAVIIVCAMLFAACGAQSPDEVENELAKISTFSVVCTNVNYTLVDDVITMIYGGDYRLSANDFSLTAIYDDETSKTLTTSELNDYGFTFESNIPDSEKTPVGRYEILIKHKDIETSKTISLVVEKTTINYNKSDVVWSASEFVYDGTEKSVTITNLPDTLTAVYQNNVNTSADEYTASATICAVDGDNYNFEEITVEHTWKINLNTHTIAYENTCGLENNNPTTYTMISDTITLAPLYGRAHYTFDGWYYNNEKITTISTGFRGGDITLEARWTAIVYTIDYQDTKDMVNNNPTSYTIEDGTITLSALANRVDYTFRYWERVYDNPYLVDILPTTTISATDNKGNITLKAVWDRKTEYDAFEYTVSEDCTKATITGLKDDSSTQITIPSGVAAIGDNAFKNCTSLTTVTFEEGSRLLTIGDYAFYHCGIRDITLPDTVTEIGNYAFARSGICNMNFSNEGNLTTIGNNAFGNCEGLVEFTIPDSVVGMGKNVFAACINLTKIVFGKGMTVIGENVYGGSSVLREIEFKGIITSFHKNALSNIATQNITLTLNRNQEYLEKVAYVALGGGESYSDDYRAQGGRYRENKSVDSTTTFCGITFDKVCFLFDATDMTADEFGSELSGYSGGGRSNLKFVLPENADNYFSAIATLLSKYDSGVVGVSIDGATSIPSRAFDGCTALKEIVVGKSVTSIGQNAFWQCTSLADVTLPSGITSIAAETFGYCSSLTSIIIPAGVTSVGQYAFDRCTALTSVTIPDSVTSLEYRAFWHCSSLNAVYISDIVSWINISLGELEANPLSFAKNLYLNNQLVEDLVIPKSVTKINYLAFAGCTSIKTLAFEEGSACATIDTMAFYKCTSLKNITLPECVETIEASAFYDCTALDSITILNKDIVIQNSAFYNCSALSSLYFIGTEEEWIIIYQNYNSSLNDLANPIVYYYSATRPTDKEGHYWCFINDTPTIWW